MDEPVVVAVVEDDSDLRELYRLRLTETSEVITVPDGGAALRRIDDEDVVLLDRQLPECNGDEVAERLRARGYGGAIAMVTGERPDLAVVTLPIDEYVTKPIDRADLRTLVDRMRVRSDLDGPIRELFAAVTRRRRLEAAGDGTVTDSDAFRRLSRRIERQYSRTIDDGWSPDRIAALAERTLDAGIDVRATIDSVTGESPDIDTTAAGHEI